MSRIFPFVCLLSLSVYEPAAAQTPLVPLEIRLYQAAQELKAGIKNKGENSLKRDERKWFILPTGAADYFRDRNVDVAGPDDSSVIVTMTLTRDAHGKLDLGLFNESKELRELFDSREVRKHLAKSESCFVSVDYSYIADWSDVPPVHFPCYSVFLTPLPKGPTLHVYMGSGLEPIQQDWKDIGPAIGTISARLPKNSSMYSYPKLLSTKSGKVIPNFRTQPSDR